MVTDEYIHINEAAERYGRTRQTFYNYVNKALIASKKINNKLYLKKSDIEKLVNDYIELLPNEWFSTQVAIENVPQSPVIQPSSVEEVETINRYSLGDDLVHEATSPITSATPAAKKSTSAQPSWPYANIQSLYNLQDDLLRLHKQAYEIKDQLSEQLTTTKNELMFDSKNTLYAHEQKIVTSISFQNKEIEHIQQELMTQTAHTNLTTKKLNFRLGYRGFVALNILILWGVLY